MINWDSQTQNYGSNRSLSLTSFKEERDNSPYSDEPVVRINLLSNVYVYDFS